MKNILKVTILFCLIIGIFIIPSFADTVVFPELPVTSDSYTSSSFAQDNFENGLLLYKYQRIVSSNTVDYYVSGIKYNSASNTVFAFFYIDESTHLVFATEDVSYTSTIQFLERESDGYTSYSKSNLSSYNYNSDYDLRYATANFVTTGYLNLTYYLPIFNTLNDGLSALRNYIDNPPDPTPTYNKNANVDKFIANTLISMGIRYNQYSDALSIASSAWNYIIDEDNWYIGSGNRNDKDIKWNIETAVSYANAQSNNYKDWYNGYKVNKDLTIALAKFISDNYTASTVGEGTLAGFSVKYNSNYNYGTTSGTSGFSDSFGNPPNALSFYPASTITYFNGAYLHDNDVIDQDEFVYTPADVRKFIGYPSTSGIIESPDSTPTSGTITDGNGDTVYNIDLEFPSLDWLANAIQSLLDFLDRLITTIADFLTQILDAILSLFSDAFESLTAFGQGLIEWLYSVVGSFSTLGSNYIPGSLWSVLLPFIFLNIGVGLILFVLRSH